MIFSINDKNGGIKNAKSVGSFIMQGPNKRKGVKGGATAIACIIDKRVGTGGMEPGYPAKPL